jgi:hypothetical protein
MKGKGGWAGRKGTWAGPGINLCGDGGNSVGTDGEMKYVHGGREACGDRGSRTWLLRVSTGRRGVPSVIAVNQAGRKESCAWALVRKAVLPEVGGT